MQASSDCCCHFPCTRRQFLHSVAQDYLVPIQNAQPPKHTRSRGLRGGFLLVIVVAVAAMTSVQARSFHSSHFGCNHTRRANHSHRRKTRIHAMFSNCGWNTHGISIVQRLDFSELSFLLWSSQSVSFWEMIFRWVPWKTFSSVQSAFAQNPNIVFESSHPLSWCPALSAQGWNTPVPKTKQSLPQFNGSEMQHCLQQTPGTDKEKWMNLPRISACLLQLLWRSQFQTPPLPVIFSRSRVQTLRAAIHLEDQLLQKKKIKKKKKKRLVQFLQTSTHGFHDVGSCQCGNWRVFGLCSRLNKVSDLPSLDSHPPLLLALWFRFFSAFYF